MRPALALHLDQAAHEVVRRMLLVLPTPVPRVEVIHAFDDPYRVLTYSSLSDDDAEEREEKLRRKATEELETLLATALAKANVRPEDASPLTPYVRYGSPRLWSRGP